MNISVKKTATIALFSVAIALATITGCKKKDVIIDPPPPVPAKKSVYNLKIKDKLGISGTVTFTEAANNTTTIDIAMTGADAFAHPAHIHMNSVVEGGGVVLSLNSVDASGKSSTVVSKLDDNTAISYNQLIAFDGYLNVHQSTTAMGVIIAQADIGGNAITTTNKSYTLNPVNSSGVSGTALFEKRVNGNTLVTMQVTGTISGKTHPAHIHLGSVATVGGGPIVRDLNSVDGTSGKSYTNVRALNNGTPITYDNWLLYDGYINLHESASDLTSIISNGNIGSN